MNSSRKKLLILFLFLFFLLGGGYILSRKINRNGIKKTGYRTEHNPNYIDSAIKAKEH